MTNRHAYASFLLLCALGAVNASGQIIPKQVKPRPLPVGSIEVPWHYSTRYDGGRLTSSQRRRQARYAKSAECAEEVRDFGSGAPI